MVWQPIFSPAVDPGLLALMIPVIVVFIPIAAILTKHQQKMTEIIHGNASPQLLREIESLKSEVLQMRGQLNDQAYQIENLRGNRTAGLSSSASTSVEPPATQQINSL